LYAGTTKLICLLIVPRDMLQNVPSAFPQEYLCNETSYDMLGL